MNQLSVMTRVAAAENSRPLPGSTDPADVSEKAPKFPAAPRLLADAHQSYYDVATGVDEAIARARKAGEVDAERLVRDAQEGVRFRLLCLSFLLFWFGTPRVH